MDIRRSGALPAATLSPSLLPVVYDPAGLESADMPRTRSGETVGDWEKLAHTVTPEILEDDPALKLAYGKLQGCIEEIHKLVTERDFHEARKQEATRRIQEILEAGRREATFLRAGLKQRYGDRNEELARFGMRPFRGRKRAKKARETGQEDSSRPRKEPSE
jgi:hypothetical protein